MDARKAELAAYVSVDVEASGPNPAQYSLLSIGAATVAEPRRTFYAELQPVNENFTAEAMEVNRLFLAELSESGLPPEEAMRRFERWLTEEIPPNVQPIFVGFNAPFDWMFVNDYFHRYLGHNPFGHNALDIKAFSTGLTGAAWRDTTYDTVSARFLDDRPLSHNALQDAVDQAEMFANMLAETPQNGGARGVRGREPHKEGGANE